MGVGDYHWQARVVDSRGGASGWQSAGGNSESVADFKIVKPVVDDPLLQCRQSGLCLARGETTTETTLIMKGTVHDADGDNVQLEVEIQRLGDRYTDSPTCTSAFVASGNQASATCANLASGSYRWRGRPRDTTGAIGDWREAGFSDPNQEDFTIVATNQSPQFTAAPLVQYGADGTTPLAAGVSTTDRTLVMKGTATDPDGQTWRLDVEVQPIDQPFTGSANCVSGPLVASGSRAAATCPAAAQGFALGSYHWQARPVDSQGLAGGWRSAGRSRECLADFKIIRETENTPLLVPLYRLYHSSAGERDHFYTTSLEEKLCAEADTTRPYRFERIEAYVFDRPFLGGTPLYRVFSNSLVSHYYTTDLADRDAKLSAGYVAEGITGYIHPPTAPARDRPCTVQLMRLRQTTEPGHYALVVRKSEYDYWHPKPDWEGDGGIGWVSAFGLQNGIAHQRPQATVGGVDTGTGAFRQAYALPGIAFHSFGPPLAFSLHYNSQNLLPHPVAPGWNHTFDAFAVEDAARNAIIKWGDGAEACFTWDGARHTPEAGNYDKLTRVENGVDYGYDLLTKDQTKYAFRQFTINNPVDPSGFNPSLLLVQISDRYGNPVVLTRAADSGLLERAKDAARRELRFAYDSQGRVQTITDPQLNRRLDLEYDPETRNLTTFTDARRNTTRFFYNADNQMEAIQRPRGNLNFLTLGYDAVGRVTSHTLGSNPSTQLYYDPSAPRVRVTDPANKTTVFGYDANRSLNFVQRAQESAAAAVYDPQHPTLPSETTDHRGNKTWFTYDANGNVTSVKNALNQIAESTWDTYNNLTSTTDFYPVGSAKPTPTNYCYDDPSRPRSIDATNPENETTHFDLNASGQVTSILDGRRLAPTQFEYDASHDLWKVIGPEPNQSQGTVYTRDGVGRIRRVVDAKGKKTDYEYDHNDNVTKVIDHDEHAVVLDYDPNDNLDLITYTRGGQTDTIDYWYDALDRLEFVQDPLGRRYAYTYWDSGLLKTRTDSLNRVTTYTYDLAQRLSTIQYPDHTITLNHDSNGNLTDVIGPAGTTHFDYDELNRITQYISPFRTPVPMAVAYEYFPAGTLKRLTYPGSRVVDYAYDLANRLKTVTDWTGATVTYGYDAVSNVKSVQHPNSTRTDYDYDLDSRLKSIAHTKPGATIASYNFVLDAVGNHESVTAVQPIAPLIPPAADITYTVGLDNRLTAQTDGTQYTYDNNGNRIGKSGGPDGTFTYGYDFENRLTRVTGPSGTIDHSYDGLGNRVARTDGAGTTRYVLDLEGD
ncbi:MAG: RHS repeat protein, partial [Deltaproteobacteria bacterium]|nr:RHS repeat protein [Deltaproteobacteria bacterium]